MRISMLALAGAFVMAGTAAQAADPMADTYANTVNTKNTKTGAAGMLLFSNDGTYLTKATGPDGKSVAIPGKWVTKDNGVTLCLSPGAPPNAPETCTPLAIHPIGEHWTVTNSAGDSFDVVLTAGR